MISALAWVPKGASAIRPKEAQHTEEAMEETRQRLEREAAAHGGQEEEEEEGAEDGGGMEEEGSSGSEWEEEKDEEEDGNAAVARARAMAAAVASTSGKQRKGSAAEATATDSIEAGLRELDMDDYDNDDVVPTYMGGLGLEVAPHDDPYMVGGPDESDSDDEDKEIKPTDLVILATRNEDDVSNLEVWVYEEAEELGGEANVYVHHELMLPAFPLCLAWLDCPPGAAAASTSSGSSSKSKSKKKGASNQRGNYVAVGSMEVGIEIWDLDVIDAVEPVAVLGGIDKSVSEGALASAKEAAGGKLDKAKKKKVKEKLKKQGPAFLPGSHTDAVLGLSWNREFRNVLASASADHTVKVWDVARLTVEHTFTHHTDKVQAVAWNPVETPVLLTGGFDKLAALVDVRSPSTQPATWRLSADVESVLWSPHDPTYFLVSCEDGLVAVYDARKGAGAAPVFRLSAHDKPTCAMSFCPSVPGLLATAATDKRTKLWDVSSGAPVLLASQDLQVGAVFTMGFAADAPHLLAVGGAMGSVIVWDIRAVEAVASRFPQLLPGGGGHGGAGGAGATGAAA